MFQVASCARWGGVLRLHIFQRGGCGWAGSVPPGRPISPSECRTYQAQTVSRIRALRPDVIVLSEADVIKPYRTKSQISASLSVFAKLAKRVIVLGHTPGIYPFAYCLSGSSDISRCARLLSGSYRRARALREDPSARLSESKFVDTSAWFCVPVGGGRTACPSVIDTPRCSGTAPT